MTTDPVHSTSIDRPRIDDQVTLKARVEADGYLEHKRQRFDLVRCGSVPHRG